jgi:ketosteroid isomerase-like protein
MTRSGFAWAAMLVALAGRAAVAQTGAPAAAQSSASGTPASTAAAALFRADHSAAECAVWRRELSFARSVEAHDAVAFAAHVHPGAVFNAGAFDATRGRAAVVEAWAGLIEGRAVALRWRPGVVNIGGDPDIALSRGPFVLEDLRPGARTRWRVGEFQSVWVREGGGAEWRVLFDGSASAPQAVDSAEAAQRYVETHSAPDCTAR